MSGFCCMNGSHNAFADFICRLSEVLICSCSFLLMREHQPMKIACGNWLTLHFRFSSNLYLFTEYCLIVCLEFFDSCIGQRMFCHLLDYLVRNGCNICACKCAVCYMDRVTDTCCDDLCVISATAKISAISRIRSTPAVLMSSSLPRNGDT